MDELEKTKIYAQCVSLWGIYPQMFMAVEELAELIFTISKFDRAQATSDDIAGEIADCRIMMNQLMHVVGLSENQVKIKEIEKMERLKERIAKDVERRKNRGRD
jgi:hypothetical protein